MHSPIECSFCGRDAADDEHVMSRLTVAKGRALEEIVEQRARGEGIHDLAEQVVKFEVLCSACQLEGCWFESSPDSDLERRSREKEREALGPEADDAIQRIIGLSDEKGRKLAREAADG